MAGVLNILIVLALIGVVAVLFTGVFAMARGGEFNRKYGNVLMRWRVLLQLATVLLLLIFFLTRGG